MTLEQLLNLPQYSLPQREKESILLDQLNTLTARHRARCPGYARLLDAVYSGHTAAATVAEVPFLPVGLFKSHELRSIGEGEIFKTLTSSGTTGQQVSRIFLDSETARRQSIALTRILTHVLGPARLPMLFVESASLLKNRRQFSARAAGVLGMMNFGRNHTYLLDDDMQLNAPALRQFLEAYGSRPFVIFGFTFMAWQYLLANVRGQGIDLSNAILIHSGGWKKLQEMAVSNQEFRRQFQAETGLHRIYNFYGMVEQVGSVYLEGEDGFLYAPNFADIIIRNPRTWQEAAIGEQGIIQVVSVLPGSYPGHSILTEDLGVVHGIDNGPCGRKGKYFSVLGRMPRAELRGCSDTHAAQRQQQWKEKAA